MAMSRLRSFAETYGDQALVSGMNFLTSIVLARVLGASEFGVFTLIWLLVLASHTLQTSVVLSPMLALVPKVPEHDKVSYAASVTNLQLCVGIGQCVVLLLGYFAICMFDEQYRQYDKYVWLFLLVSQLSQLHEFARRAAFAVEAPTQAIILDVARYLIFLVCLGAFHILSIEFQTLSALLCVSLSCLPGTLFCLFRLWSYRVQRAPLRRLIQKHWSISRWLLPSALLQWVGGNFIYFALGFGASTKEVGALRALQSLLGLTNILLEAMNNYAPVVIARRIAKTGLISVATQVRRYAVFLIMGTTFLVVPITVFYELLVTRIFGHSFLLPGTAVHLMCGTYLVIAAGAGYRFGLLAMEYTKPIFVGYLIASSLTVLTAMPLIEYLGIVGAVLGILAIQLVLATTFLFSFELHTRRRDRLD